MPRVYDKQSDPHDFCRRHFPNKKNARKRFDVGDDGPDGRGNCFAYDAEHPLYSNTDYTCESCGCILNDEDD